MLNNIRERIKFHLVLFRKKFMMNEIYYPSIKERLTDRKEMLLDAVKSLPGNRNLNNLLSEVDAALKEMDSGTYGICRVCNEPIEKEQLLADPLLKVCLSHLSGRQQQALEDDLEYASKIQRALLPDKEVKTTEWEFAYLYRPAGIVSGDFYDIIPSSDGSYLFIMGDVSGKGVSASIMMSNLHALLHSLQSFELPINEILKKANRLFCKITLSDNYATLVVGRVFRDGTIGVCVAGHNPPLVVSNGKITPLNATGIPVGMFCDAEYGVEKIKLNKNDFLFLYTDGLTEASVNEMEYGTDNLKKHLAGLNGLSSLDIISNVLLKQQAYLGTTKHEDDLTVAAIRKI